MGEEELARVWILRKLLHAMDDVAAIEFMVDKLKDTKTNAEFFASMRGR
jgi:transcription termination factor Rho